jgi:tetratricopeptide (TPR) repeat protein
VNAGGARRLRGPVLWPLVCLAAALVAGGCAPIRPAAERTVADLLGRRRDGWNRPLRLTSGPGTEFNADFADGAMAYVSDRDGSADVFYQADPVGALEPPVKLAPHSARDRWPRFAPGRRLTGRRVVFVSGRQDGGGDLWLVGLPGRLGAAEAQRLTGAETADDQPCWHPDGDRIFYASSPSLGEPFDVWEMRPGGGPARLTRSGVQMPDCSPDGRFLVVVLGRRADSGDLYVMRLEDGTVAALTSGPELDLYPCWSHDGARVLFARIAYDTNRDGSLDGRDAASICSVRFFEGIFEDGGQPPVRHLTSSATSDTLPRPLPGGFAFTRVTGPGDSDVFALGSSGEAPAFERVSESFRFAREVGGGAAADVHRSMLAWQNAAWAARAALETGEVAFDLASRDEAAEAWLELGRALVEAGWEGPARGAFEEMLGRFPGARRHGGLARMELLGLERRRLLARGKVGGTGADAAARRWDEHLQEARALRGRYVAWAQEAAGRSESAEAEALRETAALAQLEMGRAQSALADYGAAVETYQAVPERFPEQREACAGALLASAEAYALLGDPEAVRAAYLRVLEDYADLPRQATQAAAAVVGTIVRPDAGFEDRLAGLRGVIEQYPDVPVLPALAQNYVGDLHYARKDYLAAVEAYRRTIEEYPDEPTQAAAAHLAIGRIRTEQQDYERAVATFERMQALFQKSGGRLYEEARRGYARSMLRKAARELRLGDALLAMNTYSSLIEFDPSLVAAHRGLVRSYARLGRAGEAVLAYRPRVERDPRDHVASYALALAYSYYGPSDWVGDGAAARLRRRIDREALRLVGRAVLMDFESPYYHQLRGFLLSRLALITGEAEHRIRALDAYLAALGLSRAEDDAENHAALLFNVGEGYMLVDQPVAAYDYYGEAVAAGFAFESAQGEAALMQIGRSALAAGDYPFAVRMLERALGIQREAANGDGSAGTLRRRAETLDLLALAHHMDGDYAGAVGRYRAYAATVERLIEADPGRAQGYRQNLLRARRNLAVNLCRAAEAGAEARDRLGEAHRLLSAAARDLTGVGAVEWDEAAKPALLTMDFELALGEREGPARFDAAAEMRLLLTYLARVEALAGDHAAAAGRLRDKLALYPGVEGRGGGAGRLAEQAVVWTQIGGHQLAGGRFAEAADAYARAVELDRRAGNLEGEALAAVSWGRALLRADDEGVLPPGGADAAAQAHRSLLERVRSEGGPHLASEEAALAANLTALSLLTGSEAREETR